MTSKRTSIPTCNVQFIASLITHSTCCDVLVSSWACAGADTAKYIVCLLAAVGVSTIARLGRTVLTILGVVFNRVSSTDGVRDAGALGWFPGANHKAATTRPISLGYSSSTAAAAVATFPASFPIRPPFRHLVIGNALCLNILSTSLEYIDQELLLKKRDDALGLIAAWALTTT